MTIERERVQYAQKQSSTIRYPGKTTTYSSILLVLESLMPSLNTVVVIKDSYHNEHNDLNEQTTAM